ncbi:MUB1/samB family protein [Pleurotus pulmonarius]
MATAIYTHQPPANYSSYHALAPRQSQYASSSSHHTHTHSSSSSSKKMHKESREQREQREMRERGYRLCDQCGAVENPAVARFRLCGGCMTTQYCSQDCQKAHWGSHKAICQHTAHSQSSPSHSSSHHPSHSSHESQSSSQHSQYGAYGAGNETGYGGGYTGGEGGYEGYGGGEGYEETVKSLRKYTSTHTALLGWAGFQALRLKKVPANIRHSVLVINLTRSHSSSSHSTSTSNSTSTSYNSSSTSSGGRSKSKNANGSGGGGRSKSANKFSFHSTQILPLSSYLTDPLILADIARRSQRSRASGGVGCLIVILKGGEINQVVPVEVDRVEGIQWAERADWENVLREGLEGLEGIGGLEGGREVRF